MVTWNYLEIAGGTCSVSVLRHQRPSALLRSTGAGVPALGTCSTRLCQPAPASWGSDGHRDVSYACPTLNPTKCMVLAADRPRSQVKERAPRLRLRRGQLSKRKVHVQARRWSNRHPISILDTFQNILASSASQHSLAIDLSDIWPQLRVLYKTKMKHGFL